MKLERLWTGAAALALLLCVNETNLIASSFTATQSGNWSASSTWGGAGVPGSGDSATVGGFTVTLDSNVTIATLGFSAGLIQGLNLTVTSTCNWDGGDFDGGGTLTIPVGATLNISGVADHLLSTSRILDNLGTAHWTGGNIVLNNSALFNNDVGALFSAECDCTMTNTFFAGSFSNAGTFRKAAGSGLTHVISAVPFISNGLIEINSGTFTADTLTLNAGAVIAGNGGFLVNAGSTMTVSGAASVPAGETMGFAGGIVNGAATLTVSGTLNWTGGDIDSGSVLIATGGVLNLYGTDKIVSTNGFLHNSGTAHWTAGNIVLNNSGVFDNQSGGVFSDECDCTVTNTYFNGSFTNAGIFRKITATGLTHVTSAVPFISSGQIDITTGTFTADALTLNTGATITGTGFLINTGGTTTVAGNASVPSGQTMELAGGTLNGAGTLTVSGTFNWSGGSVDSSAALVIGGTGVLNLTGAAQTLVNTSTVTNGGTTHWISGNLIINNSSVFNNQALFRAECDCTITNTFFNGSFSNAGTFRKTSGSGLTHAVSSVPFNNSGHIDVPVGTFTADALTLNNGSIITGTGLLINTGGTTTVAGSASIPSGETVGFAGGTLNGAGTLTVSGTLNWSGGSVDSSAALVIGGTGVLNLTGAPTLVNTSTVTNGGTTHWTAGNLIINNSSVFNNQAGALFSAECDCTITNTFFNGSFSNAGTFRKTSGSGLTHAVGAVPFNNSGHIDVPVGTFTADALTLNNGSIITGTGLLINAGGTTTVAGSASLPSGETMGFTGGTLNGAGTLTISGTMNWSGGSVDSSSALVIAAAGVLNLSSAPTLVNTSTVSNGGTTHLTTGNLIINNSSVFHNQAGALFSIDGDGGITNTFFNGSFTNTGTFRKSVATGTSSVVAAVPFNGAGGTVDVQSGIISIGTYNDDASSVVDITLNGTTAGSGFGQLALPGTTTLAGTLNVALHSGYVPNDGNTFDVLTFGTRSGDFAAKNLPTFSIGGTFSSSYTANSLRLLASLPAADLSVTQTAASSTILHNQTATFTVTVANSASSPTNATSVTLTDTFSGGTFVSANPSQGSCSGTGPVTCSLGTLAIGASATITVNINGSSPGTISNTASVSSSVFDPQAGNDSNTQTVTVSAIADLGVTVGGLASGSVVNYTATASNAGPDAATTPAVTFSLSGGTISAATSGTFTCSHTTTTASCNAASLANGGSGTIAITATATSTTVALTGTVSSPTADPNGANNQSTSTVTIAQGADVSIVKHAPPSATPGGSVVYHLDVANLGPTAAANVVVTDPTPSGLTLTSVTGGCSLFPCSLGTLTAGQTKTLTVTYSVAANASGKITNTATTSSSTPDPKTSNNSSSAFTTVAIPCPSPTAPNASVIASASSGQTYSVQWDAVAGATQYQIDEAADSTFANTTTKNVTTTAASYKHNSLQTPQAFFYRVRAFSGCGQQFGPYSATVRAIIAPLPPSNSKQHSVNVPAGSTEIVIQSIFIPGLPDGNYNFGAAVDQSWLSVRPPSGVLTPNGITFDVLADPSELPNGTFTGTLIVTLSPLANGLAHITASTTVSVPLSVNLVTPVALGIRATPPANALVIPSIGHLDGIDSHWQSDIRVSNTGAAKQSYALTFTPIDLAQAVQSTNISIDAGGTTALDDIVANWYGGAGSGGTLEIHPIDNLGRVSSVTTTVASSRTYNVTANGTLGQFIPAIPFGNFAGSLNGILSLQQIAQSTDYRTNFGLVEGSGQPAAGTMSIFNTAGTKLKDVAFSLAPFQQQAFNGLLAANGITSLGDGRVEVKVLTGTGKVTTFASVIDNRTGDPLLVSGVPLGATSSTRYVLPGVADISNALANWRTDMRVLNAGSSPQTATLTFMPIGGGANITSTTTINPGEEKALDNVVQSLFGTTNVGGSVHVTTSSAASLVVTGRTYNQTSNGTYGQFISAVTAADAVGTGDRTLQVLQVEDSPRYRTNLGIAEVTGQPATVEISIVLPDSRVTPKITLQLAPFEYRQFAPIRDAGLGNAYNARIAVKVTSGTGKVTAYGSVIDQETQDPTYVPAQ